MYIALRMFFYDKAKALVTLLGVVFAVSLMFTQIGIWIGMMESSSIIIDHTPADIWLTSKNSRNFDFSQSIPEYIYYQALSVPGVKWAEKLIVAWGLITEKEGGTESIEIIGYNPDTGVGGPWKMKEGATQDVKNGYFVIVDQSAMKKLGNVKVGEYRDIVSRRVQVRGISEGARAFTTAPFVFMAYDVAQQLGQLIGPDKTAFVVAKVAPGYSVRDVIQHLKEKIHGVDVYSSEEFSRKTRFYWTFETGIGSSFLLTIVISFLIGMLIVGQTLYNSTSEYIKEYGTLMALGASNLDVYKIVFSLAIISGVLGFAISLAITALLVKALANIGMVMVMKPWVNFFMLGVALFMCISSAFVSINKIKHLDPYILFMG